MKMNSNILTVLPKASYIVTKSGVKTFGIDSVSGARVSLNISKQQAQYKLFEQIWKMGLGKQYV